MFELGIPFGAMPDKNQVFNIVARRVDEGVFTEEFRNEEP
jgi:hypothetical protein